MHPDGRSWWLRGSKCSEREPVVRLNAALDLAAVEMGDIPLFVVLQKVEGDWKIARYSFSTTNPRP